ncbi:MAG: class I SAM-dependent methyltransferase [Actinomycetaceae bacterium]|nr:class I SAM-dependent methyltransferase [Actinomycetaceae bacterium]
MESRGISELVSRKGQELLDSLPPYSSEGLLALSERLRAEGHSPELIAAALTQSRLRAKARSKFGDVAGGLLLTSAGLEQATRLSVGRRHAATLVEAGARHVVDFGCGIGADSLAFAEAGLTVTAIEADEITALFAARNVPGATVVHGDGFELLASIGGADAVWLDPARRTASGKRITNPEHWSPAFSRALQVAERLPVAGIKVAPGIDHAALPGRARVEWISEGGGLLEAVVWLGVGEPGRIARVDGRIYDSGAAAADEPVVQVEPRELGAVLVEPDSAIIRSGGIAAMCREHDLAPVSPGIAYLSGEAALAGGSAMAGAAPTGGMPVPGAAAFEVLDVLPVDIKAIKKALAARGVGPLEIKKRGIDIEPERLRAKLGTRQGEPAVLILTPVMGRRRAILARRLGH